MEIINADPSYLNNTRKICIATAGNEYKGKDALVCVLYCDYYILYQPNLCFLLQDKGEIVGYILCANTLKYEHNFLKMCGKTLKQISIRLWLSKIFEKKIITPQRNTNTICI